MATQLVHEHASAERPVTSVREGLRLPIELILHTLEFVPTSELAKMLKDRTSFRDVPARIMRQRFFRMMEDPRMALSFECSLPSGYTSGTRHELHFSHLDENNCDLSAHFTFPQGGPPFTFTLESYEAFQTVLYTLSLKHVVEGSRKLTYTVTVLDGIYRFFKSSFHPITRSVKHPLSDPPTPPCSLHATHLPPEVPFTNGPRQPRLQLSSSLPAQFPFADQVTRYSMRYTSIELSVAQLLIINEENEARGPCTVFIFGR